jgi:hypothetical protein
MADVSEHEIKLFWDCLGAMYFMLCPVLIFIAILCLFYLQKTP